MAPQEFVVNPRRSPRVPAQCRVEVLHGTGTWRSLTQDIGPGGCQIVSAGPIQAGARVALSVTAAEMPETLQVAGRVAWAGAPAPARAGVSFSAGPRVARWFAQLLQACPRLADAPRRVPDRLAADARLYPGQPPEAVDLAPADLLVLGLVVEGVTAGQLRARLGQGWEAARGALFGLMARKLVVLQLPEAVPESRWRPILLDAEVLAAAAFVAEGGPPRAAETQPPPARPTTRSSTAQRCLERALACLKAGDVHDAVAHLRTALGFAPQDPVICKILAGLDPRR